MRIVLIGGGNVASSLVEVLKPVQCYVRREARIAEMKKRYGGEYVSSPDRIEPSADVYILAVTDSAIGSVSSELFERVGSRPLVVHTSGSTTMDAIDNRFVNRGVFYPLQTISTGVKVDYKSVPMLLEASNEASRKAIYKLACEVSDVVRFMDGKQREIVHLSAVFACNFTHHLLALSQEMMAENGLDFELLHPLIYHSISSSLYSRGNDLYALQTGPAVREDQVTLEKHLARLEPCGKLRDIYALLSESIREKAKH